MKLTSSLKIGVLGDGGWGTTLAIALSRKGYSVTLWSAFRDYAEILARTRKNYKFLPGIKIPKKITITANLRQATFDKELIILAVPSQYLRGVLKNIAKEGYSQKPFYVSVSKGIEVGSLKRMSEVIQEVLPNIKLAVLSGPTIAYELARGFPTTAVIACPSKKIRRTLQDIFTTDSFRIYTNDDMVGVELGGSLKNVIAIACGICDGLGFGTNAKAALLARGICEMARLGKAMGAKEETFFGLSGLGDLVTTCTSAYSRNRFVGEQIGKGKRLKEIVSGMQMVAEGVVTTKSAYALSCRHNVDMPITQQVYLVLYKNKSPLKAVNDLMGRRKKEEWD